jgi:hypothetical protein
VVGDEKKLTELITSQEVAPLLQGIIQAGACYAVIVDDNDIRLWDHGQPEANRAMCQVSKGLFLEGEEVATIVVQGVQDNAPLVEGLASLAQSTLQGLAQNNLKRMLTSELHTSVVNLSQEELLSANTRLATSEARYRELAASLEKMVEQRSQALKKAHSRLLQQEKMLAVGQLAAGVAHEINNPLGFIASNLRTLAKYMARYRQLISALQQATTTLPVEGRQPLQALAKKLKIAFIDDDLPELLGQCEEGCHRIKKIVVDLKGFSHIDDGETTATDINVELDRTLNVLAAQIPKGCRVSKDFAPLATLITQPALLCQVFVNIITNAIQARKQGLHLKLTTKESNGTITIAISDNGPGIPPHLVNRVFEPFFTTREVGEGTGMGLAVAYDIITAMAGTIKIDSAEDRGTTVTIRLPLKV